MKLQNGCESTKRIKSASKVEYSRDQSGELSAYNKASNLFYTLQKRSIWATTPL